MPLPGVGAICGSQGKVPDSCCGNDMQASRSLVDGDSGESSSVTACQGAGRMAAVSHLSWPPLLAASGKRKCVVTKHIPIRRAGGGGCCHRSQCAGPGAPASECMEWERWLFYVCVCGGVPA